MDIKTQLLKDLEKILLDKSLAIQNQNYVIATDLRTQERMILHKLEIMFSSESNLMIELVKYNHTNIMSSSKTKLEIIQNIRIKIRKNKIDKILKEDDKPRPII